MSKKLEILDKLIDVEDKIENDLKSQVEDIVRQVIIKDYGDEGKSVLDLYYAKTDDTSKEDDCPDCAKKAQELVKLMNLSTQISNSLTDTLIDKIYQKLLDYNNFKNNVDFEIEKLKESLESEGIACTKELIVLAIIKFLIIQERK